MIKECNICWWEVKMFNPSEIYWIWFKHFTDPVEKSWKKIWFIYMCLKCKAKVSCHNDTIEPMWTLADKKTAIARHFCHELLDPIWKNKNNNLKRKDLYKLLSEYMWIPFYKTHFWMFNIEECRIAYLYILKYKKDNNLK